MQPLAMCMGTVIRAFHVSSFGRDKRRERGCWKLGFTGLLYTCGQVFPALCVRGDDVLRPGLRAQPLLVPLHGDLAWRAVPGILSALGTPHLRILFLFPICEDLRLAVSLWGLRTSHLGLYFASLNSLLPT